MSYYGPYGNLAGNDVAGVMACTMPRGHALAALSQGVSGTLYCRTIALPPGLTVSALDYNQVGPGVTPSHGWMCILNNDGLVAAVTDDLGATGQSANTYYRLPLAQVTGGARAWQVPPGSSVPGSGRYWMIGLMLAAGTMGTVLGGGSTLPAPPTYVGVTAGSGALVCATGGTGKTVPPAVGDQLTLTGVAGTAANFYAAVAGS